MHNPSIDLLQKDFGAIKEKLGKHSLNHWVPSDTSLRDGLH